MNRPDLKHVFVDGREIDSDVRVMPSFKGSHPESVLSGCRVLGVHRLEAMQRLRNLRTCCRVPDNITSFHIINLHVFSGFQRKLAESGGFEPPVELSSYNGLANRRLQPLGQLSCGVDPDYSLCRRPARTPASRPHGFSDTLQRASSASYSRSS